MEFHNVAVEIHQILTSLEEAHLDAKIYQISSATLENSTIFITIVCAYLMISLRRCHFSFPFGWRGLLFVFSAIRLVFGFIIRVWTSLFILGGNTPRIVRNSRCNRSWWGWQTGSNYRGDFTFRSSVFFSFGRLSF